MQRAISSLLPVSSAFLVFSHHLSPLTIPRMHLGSHPYHQERPLTLTFSSDHESQSLTFIWKLQNNRKSSSPLQHHPPPLLHPPFTTKPLPKHHLQPASRTNSTFVSNTSQIIIPSASLPRRVWNIKRYQHTI